MARKTKLMFKPFSQIDGESSPKHRGSGLGLVISRQLIELHGGSISCHGEKGKGSIFYFHAEFGLPSSSLEEARAEATASGKTSTDITILPAIDEKSDQQAIEVASPLPSSQRPNIGWLSNSRAGNPIDSPEEQGATSEESLVPSAKLRNVRFRHGKDPREMLFRIPSDIHWKGYGDSEHDAHINGSPSSTNESCNPDDIQLESVGRVYALIVCKYPFTSEAIAYHVKQALPSNTVYETSQVTSIAAAKELFEVLIKNSKSPENMFTHVILNVLDYTEIVGFSSFIFNSPDLDFLKIIAITTPCISPL